MDAVGDRFDGVKHAHAAHLADHFVFLLPPLQARCQYRGTAVHVTVPASRWQLDNAIDTLGPPLMECVRAITQAARTRGQA